MEKLTKILVPVDFSECSGNALRYAVQLASLTQASIQVTNIVIPESEAMDYPILVAKSTQTRMEVAKERLNKFLDKHMTLLSQTLKYAPRLTTDLQLGTPIQSICSMADNNDIDLIIMGSRGENRKGIEKLIGSVAQGVVGKAKCPVMIIPEKAQFQGISTMTYATDVKDSDPFEIWRTFGLIAPLSPKVRIVHVNFKKEGDLEAWKKMEKMKHFFEERTPPVEISIHHIPGKTLQKSLNDFVDKHDTDLLVMYQSQHGFWDRLFFVSDTKNMSVHTSVPLLVQKN